jgi:Cdc6-like AAA superfamily ATPase
MAIPSWWPARRDQCAAARLANRHGLITGATGTGKTVTLQKLAESFSRSACRSSWPTSRAT